MTLTNDLLGFIFFFPFFLSWLPELIKTSWRFKDAQWNQECWVSGLPVLVPVRTFHTPSFEARMESSQGMRPIVTKNMLMEEPQEGLKNMSQDGRCLPLGVEPLTRGGGGETAFLASAPGNILWKWATWLESQAKTGGHGGFRNVRFVSKFQQK